MAVTLDLPTFVARWTAATTSEKSAAQSHFIDLCALLGQPAPMAADPAGEWYTFERGARKVAGGDGWADVWMRGHFAWEYKGKRKDLAAAYQQLLQYREDLENPPLLVVCDLDRFEVHTNFTGTVKRVYAFALADLAANRPGPATHGLAPLEVLRALFTAPERLRPGRTPEQATEQAAAEFAKLAAGLRARGAGPEAAAHFLMRLLFCLFAEDIGLLPAKLFTTLVERTRRDPPAFTARVRQLFAAMATGGWWGSDAIACFDGGLFADDAALDVTGDDLAILARAATLDWASIEPAIFGTLFERSLDPAKRSQLGAHYTSKADILLIVEPVLMAPLRRRWEQVKAEARALIARRDAASGAARTRQQQALQRLLLGFSAELAAVRVLDPACGSGNFLYVSLKQLLDLEKEVSLFAATSGLTAFFPQVTPAQLHGIEVNVYARELAAVVVWIGYLQWMHDNGFGLPSEPILKPLDTIRQMDAILARDAQGRPVEPEWPAAEVIIGNPPFLGDKKMRAELGSAYVDDLRRLYEGRVPGGADLVCYWFEKARAAIAAGKVKRAGLLATQGIRGGQNRKVLDRIKQTGDLFWAQSDREWILDGATVHVSMVGFDDGTEQSRMLDGEAVPRINADLTARCDMTTARPLLENAGLAFLGVMKAGPFDIDAATAARMLAAPLNVNGRPNSDVVKPRLNGQDITGRPRGGWLIDFGVTLSEAEAAQYELPFEYVREHVKPIRIGNARTRLAQRWWIHGEPRPGLRAALLPLRRFIVTPTISKHRLFVWLAQGTVPDHQLVAIARDDDYCFGVLQSRVHELWARATGTQLREAESGFRYTPTTTFETFPFPWPPGQEPAGDPRVAAIARAARELVAKRDAWLNPPGAGEAELKKRTLTTLYNQRPAWLDLAHRALDRAVLDAYGWPHDLTDEQLLERLLALNLARAAARATTPPE
jgi:type II restriction/modification system DNA methylase subunit YeeA